MLLHWMKTKELKMGPLKQQAFQQFQRHVFSTAPEIFEANRRPTHLGLLYFCLVQLDAEDLCSQPLETEVHLRTERDGDKLALTLNPRALSIFFQEKNRRGESGRSPSLPSLLIRTDWWGRSPGRTAGVCQPSLSSCAPGRLQTKHSVARKGRRPGLGVGIPKTDG